MSSDLEAERLSPADDAAPEDVFAGADAIKIIDRFSPKKHVYLKIFAERNSGSNYLNSLCALNFLVRILQGDIREFWRIGEKIAAGKKPQFSFKIRQSLRELEVERIAKSDLGWKHGAPNVELITASPIAKVTLFVLLTKHPYSWLRSLHRNSYSFKEHDPDFSQFIRQDFPVNESDHVGPIEGCDPASLYRLKALAYQRLMESGLTVIHIRYEDLLQDFEGTMKRMAQYLMRTTRKFADVERDVKGSKRQRSDFVSQYSIEAIKSKVTPEDVAYIQDKIGADMFDFLGYER